MDEQERARWEQDRASWWPPSVDLRGANLSGADLEGTNVTDAQLARCRTLKGATMPNGQKYEDWLKSKGSGEDGETSARS